MKREIIYRYYKLDNQAYYGIINGRRIIARSVTELRTIAEKHLGKVTLKKVQSVSKIGYTINTSVRG